MMIVYREPLNLVISGVGGQGNILASGLLALAATAAEFNVVVGETYGASQRGGSVMSHLRFSQEKEYGPLVPLGGAHIIVGFEPLEALRTASRYGNPETVVIVNTVPVYPVSVVLNEAGYPALEEILAAIASQTGKLFTLDATAAAREAGDPRAQNIVMINALAVSELLPLRREHFREALSQFLEGSGSEQREINRRAFNLPVELKEYKT